MATKTSSTEIIQQKEVFVKSNKLLKEMEQAGQLEPYTKYYTPDDDVNFSSLRTKVLWTLDEDLLTTNFLAQEITIEDDGYDFLEIRYRYSTAHNIERSDTIRAIAGTKGLLTFVNTPDYIFRRPFTLTTRSVITFGGGFSGTGTTESTHDGVCIPISITGIYKSPAMIYTGAELYGDNGIIVYNGIISRATTKKQLTASSYNCNSANIPIALSTILQYDFISIDIMGRSGGGSDIGREIRLIPVSSIVQNPSGLVGNNLTYYNQRFAMLGVIHLKFNTNEIVTQALFASPYGETNLDAVANDNVFVGNVWGYKL